MPVILPMSFKVNVFWRGADILQSSYPNVFIVQTAILKTRGRRGGGKRFGEPDAGCINQIVAPFEIRQTTPGFRKMTGAFFVFFLHTSFI